MPRKNVKLILAAHRAAEAARIVAKQQDIIATLKALGQPTAEAERALQTYLSALAHLESHLVRIKVERKKRRQERARSASDGD